MTLLEIENDEVEATRLAWLRTCLMVVVAIYFASCLPDASLWFGNDGWINGSRVGGFLDAADLQSQARWYLSPLWWSDSLLVTQGFLVGGMALAVVVASGRAPNWLTWIVWFMFVAVANRYMMLAGIAESWMSMTLFGIAIASSCHASSWWTKFGVRWLQIQFTVLALATLLSMWSEETWRTGLGSIAMTQPASQRVIDWTESPMTNSLAHDAVSVYLLAAIPVGLWLAWSRRRRIVGVAILAFWAGIVAALGSHFLHAAAFAANACIFLCVTRDDSPNS